MKKTYKVIDGIHILTVGEREIIGISVHEIFDLIRKGVLK